MTEGIIIKALSGFYYVATKEGVVQCRGRGVFRKRNITPLVGDHVLFQAENEKEGYIMDIKERKNELVRPPIANIDQAIITFSATEPEFNPALLDRFLVVIESKQILPIICMTKADLLSDEKRMELEEQLQVYSAIGYDVLLLSSKTKEGVDSLRQFLSNKISVFAGQSGVGKSSLLNALMPSLQLKTSQISTHLGRGKHTTRHVELFQVEDGYIADTPGFSSVDFSDIEVTELSSTFPEINRASEYCKFRGCLHHNEPKCEVKAAVQTGDISKKRYEHYLQFLEEIRERKPRY